MRGSIIPLVLGLCIGLVAVKFGVDAIKNARGAVRAQSTIEIVRAKLDINAYEKITAEMVELVETTDDTFVPGQDRITSLDDVIGHVTAKAIPMQAPVLLSMLAPEGTLPGMVGRIPLGYRAVSVRIDEVTGVAYQVRPGDFVDVIVVMDIETGSRRRTRETIAEVILQNIQVAAIGQETGDSTDVPGKPKVKPAKSATLLVSEGDVPKLHLAATRGKITLAMRGDADKVTNAINFARDSDVFAALRGEPEVEETDTKPKVAPVPQIVRADPEPEFEPCSVVIRRGSTVANVRPVTERIIFESPTSTNIIGVSEGLVGRKATTLNAKQNRESRFPEKQQGDVPAHDDREPDDQEPGESE